MAILKIARMGHPVLGRPAEPVANPADPEVRRLAADMVETMRDSEGTGLAAPQVHVPRRLIVFYVNGRRAESEPGDGEEVPLTVLINPEYMPLGEQIDEAWEACLSIPGLAGRVPRHRHIRYWGRDADGAWIEREATGFHARVVQHELDHLDGVLYPQRMRDLASLSFTSELARQRAEPSGQASGTGTATS